MTIRRIVVWVDSRPVGLQALARLAEEMQAELVGLFVENAELLQLAALPFAREVGFPSATRRALDVAAMEHSLRALATELRRACDEALRASAVKWSFQVARGSPAAALIAAASPGARTLIVPAGADPLAAPTEVALAELTEERLQGLLEQARRPILILG